MVLCYGSSSKPIHLRKNLVFCIPVKDIQITLFSGKTSLPSALLDIHTFQLQYIKEWACWLIRPFLYQHGETYLPPLFLSRHQVKYKNAKMTDNRLVYCIRRYKIQLSFKTMEKSKIPRATSICTCCFHFNKTLNVHLGTDGPPHLCISFFQYFTDTLGATDKALSH